MAFSWARHGKATVRQIKPNLLHPAREYTLVNTSRRGPRLVGLGSHRFFRARCREVFARAHSPAGGAATALSSWVTLAVLYECRALLGCLLRCVHQVPSIGTTSLCDGSHCPQHDTVAVDSRWWWCRVLHRRRTRIHACVTYVQPKPCALVCGLVELGIPAAAGVRRAEGQYPAGQGCGSKDERGSRHVSVSVSDSDCELDLPLHAARSLLTVPCLTRQLLQDDQDARMPGPTDVSGESGAGVDLASHLHRCGSLAASSCASFIPDATHLK